MAVSAREPMRNVDKAWLDMDTPSNLMIINGVMLFDGVLDFELALEKIETRLVQPFPRYRQRVINTTGPGMAWEEDEYFDLRYHVVHVALPAPGAMDALQEFMSILMSEGLDPSRPLWRIYVIENVAGGSALFTRMHHCIADGVALVQVLLSLTDAAHAGAAENVTETNAKAEAKVEARSQAPRGLLGSLGSLAGKGLRAAALGAGVVVNEAAAAWKEPSRIKDGLYLAGLASVTSAAIVGKLLLIPPDSDSAFKGDVGPRKRVVWTDPIPLPMVKALGRRADATINDLLVAAVAGALRRYMLESGRPTDIRAMVPVNLRDPKEPIIELGNRFSLVYLTLPLEKETPLERLHVVKSQMDILKKSPEPLIVYEILTVVGMAPGELADYATSWFSSKASVVLTNVPGPRETICFAGLPLRRILFWVPQTGRIGLGVSIISYNDEVTLGIMVDERLVAQPLNILNYFTEEFACLRETLDALGK